MLFLPRFGLLELVLLVLNGLLLTLSPCCDPFDIFEESVVDAFHGTGVVLPDCYVLLLDTRIDFGCDVPEIIFFVIVFLVIVHSEIISFFD